VFRYYKIFTAATFAFFLLGMVTSSCGKRPTGLGERVREYWEARIKGQVEKSFEFEAPGAIDKSAYLKWMLTAPVAFTSYSIKTIKEDNNKAVVELHMEYLLPGLSRPVSSSMSEEWVRVKGQWYHHLPVGDDGTSVERR
jgi:hypothetical protein